MNLFELQRSLRQLRLGGMASVLETRLRQAQAEPMAPIDLLSMLVADELTRCSDRLLERRRKHARYRDPDKNLDNFDFTFNPKMNRAWFSIWPLAVSSTGAKTDCFLVQAILRHSAPPCYALENNGRSVSTYADCGRRTRFLISVTAFNTASDRKASTEICQGAHGTT